MKSNTSRLLAALGVVLPGEFDQRDRSTKQSSISSKVFRRRRASRRIARASKQRNRRSR